MTVESTVASPVIPGVIKDAFEGTSSEHADDFLKPYISTFPRCVVEKICDKAGKGNVFGRRRLGPSLMMIIDISGFTKLTEKYVGNKDKIQQIINAVMVPLMELIQTNHFDLIDIAGDAFLFYTVLADKKDPSVTAAAKHDQTKACLNFVARTRAFVTNSQIFKRENMEMKYAAVIGELHVDLYEGARHGWIIDGPACGKLASALKLAGRGEFICDKEFSAMAKQVGVSSATRKTHFVVAGDAPSFAGAVASMKKIPKVPMPKKPEEAKAILDKFVPDLVYVCGPEGPTMNDAVIAPAVICFINVKSIDGSPVPFDTMQKFFSLTTGALAEREGCMRQFIRDDKGTVFIGTFGSGKNIGRPAHNAMLWALDVEKIGATTELKLSIGMTMGTVYQGPLGTNKFRVDFTLMGFEVNLSARFMGWAMKLQKKKDEDVRQQMTLCMPNVADQAAECGITAVSVGKKQIKGSEDLFEAFTITDHAPEDSEDAAAPTSIIASIEPIFGRDKELSALSTALKGQGIAVIEGTTGIGKTLLALHAAKNFVGDDENSLVVSCQANEARKTEPLLPIRSLLKSLKGSTTVLADGDDIYQRLATMVGQESRRSHMSLLTSLMPWIKTAAPENDEGSLLSANDAADAKVDMVYRLLLNIADQQKTVIIFEDTQWYDPLSAQVIAEVFVSQAANHRTDCAFMTTGRPPISYAAYTKLKSKATVLELQGLETAEMTMAVMMNTLKIDQTARSVVYMKNITFAELVHQSTNGIPSMIEMCTESMKKDKTIKSSKTTLQLTCNLSEVPIFKALQGCVVDKFLALDKDKQSVLKYAALIGQDFDNSFLRTVLTKGYGLSKDAVQQIFEQLVGADFFAYVDESKKQFHFDNVATLGAIKSTMLEQQRFKLCSELSDQLLKGNPKTGRSTYKMAREFSSGMGPLGHNRHGRVLRQYGQWCIDNGRSDLVLSLYSELVNGLDKHADIVTKGKVVQPPTDQIDARLQLSTVDLHEIYSTIVCASTTIDVSNALKYLESACKLIGYPFIGANCNAGQANSSGMRLDFGPLNWFRYPKLNMPHEDQERLLRNHISMCNAAAYIFNNHFGNQHACTWWLNEGFNVMKQASSPLTATSCGTYAACKANTSQNDGTTLKAYSKFTASFEQAKSKMPNNAKDRAPVERQLTNSLINNIWVRMVLPSKFDFKGQAEAYDTWAKSAIDGKKNFDDFFMLSTPLLVSCAFGITAAPKRVQQDAEKGMAITSERFEKVKQTYERVSIGHVIWFATHMQAAPGVAVAAWREKLNEKYAEYVVFSTGNNWPANVLIGTKFSTIAIHHARVLLGGPLVGDVGEMISVILSLWSQIGQYTVASKHVSVSLLMAHDVASHVLFTLDEITRQKFGRKLMKFMSWIEETMAEKSRAEAFPQLHSVANLYFKAKSMSRNSEAMSMEMLKKVAEQAKQQKFMIIYVNAMMELARVIKSKTIFEDIRKAVAGSGLQTYAEGRILTHQECFSR